MLGKPLVCMALSSAQRSLAPLDLQRCPLFLPFINRSLVYYVLQRCRQAGLDSVVMLLDEPLYRQLDQLRLHLAGLPLSIEWLCHGEADWQDSLIDQLTEDDPVLLLQNPALDLLPLGQLLDFHREQQGDCSLRLSPRPGLNPQPVRLDAQGQIVGQTLSQGERRGFDTRTYLIEPDIFEELLAQPLNLLRQPLLPALLEAAQYVSGLLSEAPWLEWQQPQDFFTAQARILNDRLLEPVHQRLLERPHARVWLGEDVLIGEEVTFQGPVVIGDQVSLAKGTTVIGPALVGSGSQVQAQCRIEKSWIWPGCELGRGSQLQNSWLGEQVKIAAHSRLDRLWAADHSRLSLPLPLPPATVLGPHSRIETENKS